MGGGREGGSVKVKDMWGGSDGGVGGGGGRCVFVKRG